MMVPMKFTGFVLLGVLALCRPLSSCKRAIESPPTCTSGDAPAQ
jgi:hypothetical protein